MTAPLPSSTHQATSEAPGPESRKVRFSLTGIEKTIWTSDAGDPILLSPRSRSSGRPVVDPKAERSWHRAMSNLFSDLVSSSPVSARKGCWSAPRHAEDADPEQHWDMEVNHVAPFMQTLLNEIAEDDGGFGFGERNEGAAAPEPNASDNPAHRRIMELRTGPQPFGRRTHRSVARGGSSLRPGYLAEEIRSPYSSQISAASPSTYVPPMQLPFQAPPPPGPQQYFAPSQGQVPFFGPYVPVQPAPHPQQQFQFQFQSIPPPTFSQPVPPPTFSQPQATFFAPTAYAPPRMFPSAPIPQAPMVRHRTHNLYPGYLSQAIHEPYSAQLPPRMQQFARYQGNPPPPTNDVTTSNWNVPPVPTSVSMLTMVNPPPSTMAPMNIGEPGSTMDAADMSYTSTSTPVEQPLPVKHFAHALFQAQVSSSLSSSSVPMLSGQHPSLDGGSDSSDDDEDPTPPTPGSTPPLASTSAAENSKESLGTSDIVVVLGESSQNEGVITSESKALEEQSVGTITPPPSPPRALYRPPMKRGNQVAAAAIPRPASTPVPSSTNAAVYRPPMKRAPGFQPKKASSKVETSGEADNAGTGTTPLEPTEVVPVIPTDPSPELPTELTTAGSPGEISLSSPLPDVKPAPALQTEKPVSPAVVPSATRRETAPLTVVYKLEPVAEEPKLLPKDLVKPVVTSKFPSSAPVTKPEGVLPVESSQTVVKTKPATLTANTPPVPSTPIACKIVASKDVLLKPVVVKLPSASASVTREANPVASPARRSTKPESTPQLSQPAIAAEKTGPAVTAAPPPAPSIQSKATKSGLQVTPVRPIALQRQMGHVPVPVVSCEQPMAAPQPVPKANSPTTEGMSGSNKPEPTPAPTKIKPFVFGLDLPDAPTPPLSAQSTRNIVSGERTTVRNKPTPNAGPLGPRPQPQQEYTVVRRKKPQTLMSWLRNEETILFSLKRLDDPEPEPEPEPEAFGKVFTATALGLIAGHGILSWLDSGSGNHD